MQENWQHLESESGSRIVFQVSQVFRMQSILVWLEMDAELLNQFKGS